MLSQLNKNLKVMDAENKYVLRVVPKIGIEIDQAEQKSFIDFLKIANRIITKVALNTHATQNEVSRLISLFLPIFKGREN